MQFDYHRHGTPVARVRVTFDIVPEDVLTATLDALPLPHDLDEFRRRVDALTRRQVDDAVRTFLWDGGHGEANHLSVYENAWDRHDSLIDEVRSKLEHLYPEWGMIRRRHGGADVA